MNLAEAKSLVQKIEKSKCGGRPLVVYDGDVTQRPFGEPRKRPFDSDPGTIVCRLNFNRCFFTGGPACPNGLKEI